MKKAMTLLLAALIVLGMAGSAFGASDVGRLAVRVDFLDTREHEDLRSTIAVVPVGNAVIDTDSIAQEALEKWISFRLSSDTRGTFCCTPTTPRPLVAWGYYCDSNGTVCTYSLKQAIYQCSGCGTVTLGPYMNNGTHLTGTVKNCAHYYA